MWVGWYGPLLPSSELLAGTIVITYTYGVSGARVTRKLVAGSVSTNFSTSGPDVTRDKLVSRDLS